MALERASIVMARTSVCLVWAPALWLAGCALQVENTQAAQAPEPRSGPLNAVYTGWRVFQGNCAGCHGADATGGAGPDLLPRMRDLRQRQFVDMLLARYEWTNPPAQPTRSGLEREAWIDDIVQRRKGALVVPAGQGEPRVNAYVVDLYAWLSARADGTQGPGRPAGP
jgi:mono/diheme cytochrome c family protein